MKSRQGCSRPTGNDAYCVIHETNHGNCNGLLTGFGDGWIAKDAVYFEEKEDNKKAYCC